MVVLYALLVLLVAMLALQLHLCMTLLYSYSIIHFYQHRVYYSIKLN